MRVYLLTYFWGVEIFSRGWGGEMFWGVKFLGGWGGQKFLKGGGAGVVEKFQGG